MVALLAEGVGRNYGTEEEGNAAEEVALLAEGVDRNYGTEEEANAAEEVALLAEGVDRNLTVILVDQTSLRRPPRGGRG